MGLTHRVWHTNSNRITLPVSSTAGKGERMHLEGVSGKGGTTADGKRKEKDEQLGKIR